MEPTIRAWALTGDRTGDLSVPRTVLYQQSHTSLYLFCLAQTPGPQATTNFLLSLVERRICDAFEKQISPLTFKMTAKGVREHEPGHVLPVKPSLDLLSGTRRQTLVT